MRLLSVVRDTLHAFGFVRKDGVLRYTSPTGCVLSVELNEAEIPKSRIDYGSDITVHSNVICNLRKEENLVVLECVIRLLDKGYSPNCIVLEKSWKLGHKRKGRLDILLRDPEKHTYALVECKTWGEEYVTERNKLHEDGGQLFSYFVQERAAKGLYLYATKVEDGVVVFQAEFVDATNLKGTSNEELFQSWDHTLHSEGLFATAATTYDSKYRNLKASDLRDLDRSTGRGIFNSFAEILRRHVLSDKSNAFNKIFNLFVCKIADEDAASPDDETDFQWKVNDTYDSLLRRLSRLYRSGLKNYLEIDVDTSYYHELAEFAFLDIYDESTFARNARVLKEVVQLLQSYRIKYSARHQFLGDFFELLLNTGVKQEAGQFFTPVPLTRFIVRSLPLSSIITDKVNSKETYVLPYILDFACGSGHFLTEAIDEVESLIPTIDRKKLTKRGRAKLEAEENQILWAREYIYGIEEDYRLAKTTKIATFLNGDGDAVIIRGNGLDDFYTSRDYRGRLKANHKSSVNEAFDVLVSNPPFAIPSFLTNLPDSDKRFSLSSYLSPQSSEIECLFLERAHQVLRPNGVVGIILPLSILNSTKAVHQAARTMLLTAWQMVAMLELRDRAFSASTSSTVVVFARKRTTEDVLAIERQFQEYFTEDGRSKHPIHASLSNFAERFPDHFATTEEWFGNERGDGDGVRPVGVDFAVAYMINCTANIIVAYSGDRRTTEAFLGYRFSTGRGKEGIHYLEKDGKLNSLMYDYDDRDHPEKLSTHIRNAFDGVDTSIPDALRDHAAVVPLRDLIESQQLTLSNPSSFFVTDVEVESNSPFGDFIDEYPHKSIQFEMLVKDGRVTVIKGLLYQKTDEVPYETPVRVLTADNIDLKTAEVVFPKVRYLRPDFQIPPELQPRAGDVLVSVASGSLRHLGKVAFVRENIDAAVGAFLNILRCDDEDLARAILYNLLSKRFRRFVIGLKDQNINNLPPHELKRFSLRVPRDVSAFSEDAKKREEELRTIIEHQRQLRTH